MVTPGLAIASFAGDPLPVVAPLPVVLAPLPVVLGLVLMLPPLPVVLGRLGVPASRLRTSFLAASQHLKLLSGAGELADWATAGAEANARSAAPANSEIVFIRSSFHPIEVSADIDKKLHVESRFLSLFEAPTAVGVFSLKQPERIKPHPVTTLRSTPHNPNRPLSRVCEAPEAPPPGFRFYAGCESRSGEYSPV